MNCPVEEELAAMSDGDLPAPRMRQIREHVQECHRCRRMLETIGRVDEIMAAAAAAGPPPAIALAVRRAIEPVLRPQVLEIMTLEQVAGFLQIEAQALGEIVDELPAFELAGQVRVRRAALLEWIAQREEDFNRNAFARTFGSSGGNREGVAL